MVLFNLGGPDGPAAVRPFLYNLFNDPAILRIPFPFRNLLASFISRRRHKIARGIYDQIGGKSPILEQTQMQADVLEKALAADEGETRVFIAMRYWRPFSAQTARQVAAWAPERVVLLPLYPQYSTTTTASSVTAWRRAAARAGLTAPAHTICCYPMEKLFIECYAERLADALAEAGRKKPSLAPRVLFSAHGLPKRIVERGDPYTWQVERTAQALVEAVNDADLDWLVSYQSRVGRLEWVGPATDEELRRAGRDNVPVIVVPISFVSEHSETLVELDMQYREVAMNAGVPLFIRVPTPGPHEAFIGGLAAMVRTAAAETSSESVCSAGGVRLCPDDYGACPMARHGRASEAA